MVSREETNKNTHPLSPPPMEGVGSMSVDIIVRTCLS